VAVSEFELDERAVADTEQALFLNHVLINPPIDRQKGVDEVRAVGEFVHVFVQRETGKPAATGMSARMRAGLEKIYVGAEASKL
jgi:hypothetical protein